MFIRRDRPATRRYTAVRVGLFFFAAGLWLAGVRIGSEVVTTGAMVVAIIAILISVALRRRAMTARGEPEVERDS